ncbi:MAG: calcium/sodium antiporter [Clostridia bacterium]|nr:calcium/sodium antiporter [Clostridia bacterium]MBQ6722509.1 calcium/sodium antiporter [Clostridia bacterium]
MLWPIVLFLVGFALLIKGGDWFVDGSVGLARRFHLPELLIGATVVSIGTTLPEVMVSSQAALEHNAGISYGNAIGSIICNTSLIAALTVAIRPGKVNPKSFLFPTLFFFIAAVSYSLVAWTSGAFTRWIGVAYLCFFVFYMAWSVLYMKKHPDAAEDAGEEEEAADAPKPLWQEILLLVIGAAAIAVGARLLVDNGTIIASALGVPDSVIGLTMIALGTSLPELITAITSLIKGHGALSLGNVIGANLFNIILVSGAAITISPFSVPAEKLIAGMNSSLIIDLPLMLAVMAILCLPTLRSGKLRRWQGVLLLCIYTAFTVYQFVS